MRAPRGMAPYYGPFDSTSLRKLAECDGLPADYEVTRDLLGYTMGVPRDTSLLTQLRLATSYAVEINIIRVGVEAFTDDDEREIDEAIAFLRDALAPVNLRLANVGHFQISEDDADGREHIADADEAIQLTAEWSVDNLALDVFVVRSVAGTTLVFSDQKGTDYKSTDGRLTGVVLALSGNSISTSYALAWGVCAYLGADESDDPGNLMSSQLVNGGRLTVEQFDQMFWRVYVDNPCGVLGYFYFSSG